MVPRLVDIVLESSTANTTYKYSNGWQRWKAWAHSKLGVPVLLAVPLQVALYLTELVERPQLEGHSASVIESALYSIQWGHRLAGMESPTIHPLVKGVVEVIYITFPTTPSMQVMLSIYLNSSTCIYLLLDNGVTITSKHCENKNLVSFICFSFLPVISLTVFGNFCDCRLLCLRSGMNLANLSTRMEMQSAEVKYYKLSVFQRIERATV